ncbi:hypothetical protein F5X68DRAFT_236373 [Plectosphaerella plurivora]|uniref:Short-chain dehydrogenase n=1 Tax=Plectosphaerella plurivora TaxID=936078 RepID=A0A9P8V2Y3_9PEZI|nr:hypothetical protein F5X68DRAFT_236373 [Plectosphaerella plurivora]
MATPTIASWDTFKEVPDLSGKVVFITGGNTGIGLETAKVTALRGATVYIGTRNEEKTKAALTKLRAENEAIKEDQIKRIPLDLLDLASIVEAAATLAKLESKLDLLFNMASIDRLAPRTADGWEPVIAGDYAGHFLFTNLLLPLLKTAAKTPRADVRIINFGSMAVSNLLPAGYIPNFTSPNVLADPVPYHPWAWRWIASYLFADDMIPYCVAKLAVVSFAAELQRRLDAEGVSILSIAIHPGEVATNQSTTSITPMLRSIAVKTFLTMEDGVKHSLYAATASALRKGDFGGKYMLPLGKVSQLHPLVDNEEQVTALWKNTEGAINEALAKKGLLQLQSW